MIVFLFGMLGQYYFLLRKKNLVLVENYFALTIDALFFKVWIYLISYTIIFRNMSLGNPQTQHK